MNNVTRKALMDGGLPANLVDGVLAYANEGREPGSFLMAVLENNLRDAVHRADSLNSKLLTEIVRALDFTLPGWCHGTQRKVDACLKAKGDRMLAINGWSCSYNPDEEIGGVVILDGDGDVVAYGDDLEKAKHQALNPSGFDADHESERALRYAEGGR